MRIDFGLYEIILHIFIGVVSMGHLIQVTEAGLSISLSITIATIVRSSAFHMVGQKVGWVICVGSYR
jgi:hypothetical protein